VTHDHDPESAARRAMEMVGGPVTLTRREDRMDEVNDLLKRIYRELDCVPLLQAVRTARDVFEWRATYQRSVRHHNRTVATLDTESVRGQTQADVLRAVLEREVKRDADLREWLKEREEAPQCPA
jgi:hypothetical protein